MAKTKRSVVFSATTITVSPDQNTFKIFSEQIPKKVEPVVIAKETPKVEKSPLEMALVISLKVKTILETYENPSTTDTVTTDDWQFVFEAAQYGHLQGYTAVQIDYYDCYRCNRYLLPGELVHHFSRLQCTILYFSKFFFGYWTFRIRSGLGRLEPPTGF